MVCRSRIVTHFPPHTASPSPLHFVFPPHPSISLFCLVSISLYIPLTHLFFLIRFTYTPLTHFLNNIFSTYFTFHFVLFSFSSSNSPLSLSLPHQHTHLTFSSSLTSSVTHSFPKHPPAPSPPFFHPLHILSLLS